MDKKKALICTFLYVAVVGSILVLSVFVRNDESGISLYQLIMYAVSSLTIGKSVEKFYNWIVK